MLLAFLSVKALFLLHFLENRLNLFGAFAPFGFGGERFKLILFELV